MGNTAGSCSLEKEQSKATLEARVHVASRILALKHPWISFLLIAICNENKHPPLGFFQLSKPCMNVVVCLFCKSEDV